MDRFDSGTLCGIVIGILIGFVLSLIITTVFITEPNIVDKRELGQAICEEEFNLDYQSYSEGKLKCQPKEVKHEIEYDGIIINIVDGE